MNEAKLTTLEQVRAFLVGTIAVEFSACGKDDDRYAHIAEVLHRFGYKRLKKPDKGLILRYLGAHDGLLAATTHADRQTLANGQEAGQDLSRTNARSGAQIHRCGHHCAGRDGQSARQPVRAGGGFHADNGSEYINHKVAKMLGKLAAEFTKSRPRHSNDNGLAETKNGAVIRKHLGYAHIPQRFAAEVNAWCAEHLNPYVNFHRPCLFAQDITDKKGKTRKRYPLDWVRTPFEKLASLPDVATFLRPGVTLDALRKTATAMSDNAAAEQMNLARQKLFLSINQRSRKAA